MHYKIPVILLSVLSVVWLTGSSYFYVCKVKDNCNSTDVTEGKENEKSKEFVIPATEIRDGDSLNIGYEGKLFFMRNTDSLVAASNDEAAWEELSDYLSKHPEKNLVVTGHYLDSESGGAQLGLNRSASFVDFFSEKSGISDKRFKSAFEVDDGALLSEDSTKVYGALSFDFNIDKTKLEEEASDKVDLEDLEVDLMKARKVYFDFGSSIMKANPALHQFFTDLEFYLSEKEGSKISLTGHTDNLGSPDKNKVLSLERAKDVRRYLMDNNNFKRKHFILKAKGQAVPIASNDTETGRAKNRRVEIKLAN